MNNLLFTPNSTKQDYFRRSSVKFSRPAPIKVVTFANHAEWTLNNTTPSSVTLSTDTTEHPGAANAAVKVAIAPIGSGAGNKAWRIYKDLGASTWDINDCTITLRYYCDASWVPYGDTYYRAQFHLLLSASTDPITNKLQYSLPISPGWHTVEITRPMMTKSGTVDEAAIRCVGIYYAANATNGNPATWNLWFDSITFTKSDRTKGGLILGFDDAYTSHLTVAKKLSSQGFRSMLFAEPNTWGTSGRLTIDQLKECEKYGMLVCGHYQGVPYDSNYPETVVADGAVHAYCRRIKQAFYSAGLRNGAEFFALPGGTAWQQSEEHIDIFRQYFTLIRGTGPFRTQGREAFKLSKHPVGAAVDKGGGLVGIPCVSHGFTPGTRINTSHSNYTGLYTVHANTTADEIVITATYVATTFTGTSKVYPWLVGATHVDGHILRYVQAANPLESWWRWATEITGADDGTYATTFNAHIDAVITAKQILETLDHDVPASGGSSLTMARLDAAIAYIRTKVDAGTLEVLTYEDLI